MKLQMTSLGISGKADAGREKWAELTEWVLTKKPLRSRAALHGRKSAHQEELLFLPFVTVAPVTPVLPGKNSKTCCSLNLP